MFTMLDDIFEKEKVSDIIRQTSTSKPTRHQSSNQVFQPKATRRDLNRSSQNRKSSSNTNFQTKSDNESSSKASGLIMK
jgi:hypothetical protein